MSDIRDLASKLDDDDNGGDASRKKSLLFGSDDLDTNAEEVGRGGAATPNIKINFGDTPVASETIKLVEDESQNKTWDGFQKMDNVPNEADKAVLEPKMKKEDLLREKFVYLRKLENLEQKGVRLSKHYSMDSNLDEMKGEYEMIVAEKERSNSVKFQGKMLMACITGMEFLNNKFDPFDLKLDGWAEQVNENINDYDEIFGELHEVSFQGEDGTRAEADVPVGRQCNYAPYDKLYVQDVNAQYGRLYAPASRGYEGVH